MNIAILSRGEALYSTKSLLNAGQARNHNIEVLDPSYCNLAMENGKAVLYFENELVDDLHAIIPRIGASNTFYGTNVVRHFEAMGVFSVVSSDGISHSRDKWTCFQIMTKNQIPVPKTVFASFFEFEEQLKTFNGKPIIIKLLEGTHGEGVILSESPQNALATIETLNAAGVKFILQEYIEEAHGTDIRAIVVDGVVVAAMRRICKDGDFRSNLHRGGSSEIIQLSSAEEKIAIKAAKAIGLGFCGVDILQSKNGPLVLEINSTPGLEGIENTSGINVSKSVIGFIERSRKK
ncbi:alpha-L-glutamate ligase, RimK family [Aequorivita sublithincola DSM 14238]|uniref:Alpha-L-glutamate ligase, RimK family n=1 Tax=Aequorivita sublithincola (strain DSM 14238 / LMG 21431 / ACAM 643 / 9-3) TaxID=746697 RepID=I3YVG1_AEQSU|nr:RimK family alpha-L-glutamate ligase [Aequorivita sublithincola]AFL80979.1 alpha-L-glutamate ligase, RimK family [Aequorivita sublithincola DSM 14238]